MRRSQRDGRSDPPVAPNVDLRDFAFMPLDVVRLRDSDLAGVATADGFRAAVLLWCASWHQVPAGSLPKDDRMLARFAGFGRDLEGWNNVKEEALRNFEECSDGRLYHPVIAEKANEAWHAKLSRRERVAAAIAARQAKAEAERENSQRDVQRDVQRDGRHDVERDGQRNVHQGTGTGTGTVDRESIKKKNLSDPAKPPARTADDFETFWKAYPHKVGKLAARKAFAKASQTATLATIIEGVQRYVVGKPADRPWLNPTTFLNQERWNDAPAPTNGNGTVTPIADNRVLVAEDSPEFAAWSEYHGRKLSTYQTDKRDERGQRIVGRYECSRYPPGHPLGPNERQHG